MKFINDKRARIVDTFAARDIHDIQKPRTLNDYIKYSVQTGLVRSYTGKRKDIEKIILELKEKIKESV